MSLRPAIILYEDSRGPRTGFGLHDLVIRCTFEEMSNILYHELAYGALRDHRPMNGNAELLKRGCYQARRIGRQGQPVIAVFDNDKIRKLLALPHTASDEEVILTILENSGAEDQLHIVLLKQNIESLLEIIALHHPDITQEQKEKAIERKNLNERDLMFLEAAKEAHRAVREQLLTENESFREFINLIIRSITVDET